MMREILFRGKAINRISGREYRTNYKNSDWVYGLVTQMHDERFGFPAEAEMTNTDGVSGIEVDYKTIGQYTGLTDKNGVQIFEGDILKGYDYPFCCVGEFNYFAEVFWLESNSAFAIYTVKNPKSNVCGISEGHTDYLGNFDSNKFEVIGNIYDNPEILGAAQ